MDSKLKKVVSDYVHAEVLFLTYDNSEDMHQIDACDYAYSILTGNSGGVSDFIMKNTEAQEIGFEVFKELIEDDDELKENLEEYAEGYLAEWVGRV